MRILAGIISLAALAGCIENPGPDKDLYRRYREATVTGYSNTLQVKVELLRKDDWIYATPASDDPKAAELDSIEFFIHQNTSFWGSPPFLRDASGRINFHGMDRKPGKRVGSVGRVEDRMPAKTLPEDYNLRILRTWKNGMPSGVPLAGIYRGTWKRSDGPGFEYAGEITLLIDNGGDLEAGLTLGTDPSLTWGLLAGVDLDSLVTVYRMVGSGNGGEPEKFPEGARARVEGDSLVMVLPFAGKQPENDFVIRCARVGVP
jgi:hypothetical protein